MVKNKSEQSLNSQLELNISTNPGSKALLLFLRRFPMHKQRSKISRLKSKLSLSSVRLFILYKCYCYEYLILDLFAPVSVYVNNLVFLLLEVAIVKDCNEYNDPRSFVY